MTRKILGLDAFNVVVQAVVTAAVAGIAGELLFGATADAMVTGIITASVLLLAWRRNRALKQEDRAPEGSERMEELDLEERLDFAERLLARQREPERIPEVPR